MRVFESAGGRVDDRLTLRRIAASLNFGWPRHESAISPPLRFARGLMGLQSILSCQRKMPSGNAHRRSDGYLLRLPAPPANASPAGDAAPSRMPSLDTDGSPLIESETRLPRSALAASEAATERVETPSEGGRRQPVDAHHGSRLWRDFPIDSFCRAP